MRNNIYFYTYNTQLTTISTFYIINFLHNNTYKKTAQMDSFSFYYFLITFSEYTSFLSVVTLTI